MILSCRYFRSVHWLENDSISYHFVSINTMAYPFRDITNESQFSSCVQGRSSCGSNVTGGENICSVADSNPVGPHVVSGTKILGKRSNRGRAIRKPNLQRAKRRITMMSECNEESGSRPMTQGVQPKFDNRNLLFDVAEFQSYIDLGDMNMACKYCGAILWYHERSVKAQKSASPDFSICCMKGKVMLPYLADCPELLSNLLRNTDTRSRHFLDNIRSYNSMFAFTSIGGKVDCGLNDGRGPPQFVISGQNYHRIGSLVPTEGDNPKFAQLYIYDTKNEVQNRMSHFSDSCGKCTLESNLVVDLIRMIDEHNVLAKSFRRVRDHVESHDSTEVALRLFRSRVYDSNTYNLPSVDEVAALIVGDFDSSDCGRVLYFDQ
ncbi:uncharacterized protein LOC130716592 [Lotus japonicus]|uniref:uncharacterized protein LOC130716592 n=1 Tax=Lotus japonicus TaxID=34305 RepID=UPI00258A6E71|nr:uncharacterized protein LOC130716592 [Lotus japonicus]